MKHIKPIILGLLLPLILVSCGIYSFSGVSIGPEVKTFEVRKFNNEASIIEAGIDRRFTTELQDFILNQTNLNLVNSNGDIAYEGEITQFFVAPNNSDSQDSTSENRLTISVRVRYFDSKNSDNDLERTFSFFSDFDSTENLSGDVLETALVEIFEYIQQDIITATLARW